MSKTAILLLLTLSSMAYGDESPKKSAGLEIPPFFTEAVRAEVDNAKGATLTVNDAKSRVNGAKVIIPPGALSADKEVVILSYSDKLPGLPSKPGDGMSFVQNSQIFALQTTNSRLNKKIELILPYYNEQEITPAGTRVVMFNYWDADANTYQTLESQPVKGRVSFAQVTTQKLYPNAEYVSLRLAHTPGFGTLGRSLPTPKGWEAVPNADSCLKIGGPKMISPPEQKPQLYEATFSNSCNYPIQASGCENKNGTKGCPLPKPVIMPPHSGDLLTLSGFSTADLASLGACRVTLADGTPVKYDLILSSDPASSTVCLIEKK